MDDIAGPIRIAVLANASQAVSELGRTERAVRGLGTSAGSVFKGGLGVAAVAGAAKLAVGAVTSVSRAVGSYIGGAVEASDATDKFKSTLDFAGLDTSTIGKLTASTQQYADQTVYSLGDIQNVTAQLAANGVPNYDKLAEAVGNLNAVAGGNAETFKSVGMVLTQTAGQGRLTTENFNQLADAVPGASGKIQQALKEAGAYTGNFRDAMEKGQITAKEFNDAVLGLGLTDVARNAATSTKTIEGAVGNLQATITGGLGKIISGIKPEITGAINGLASGLGTVFDVLGPKIVAGVQGAAKVLGPAVSGIFAALQGKDLPKGTPPWISGLVDGVQTLGPIFSQVGTAVKPVLDALGPVLGQALSALIPIITQLVGAFAQVGPGLSPLGIVLQSIAPVMPVVAAAFVQLATALSGTLATVLATVVPLLVQLGATIATTVVPVLSQLITTLLPPLVGIVTTVLGIVAQIVPVLAPIILALVGQLLPVVAQLVTALLPVLATVLGAVGQVLVALAPVLLQVAGLLAGVFAQAMPPIIQAISLLASLITALLPVVQSVFTTVVGVIKGALTVVSGIIRVFSGVLKGDWSEVWAGLGQIVSGAWQIIKSVVLGAARTLQAGLSAAMSAIKSAVSSAWSSVVSTVKSKASQLVGFVRSIPGRIVSALGNLGGLLVASGRSMLEGLAQGIRNGVSAAVGAAKDALGAVRNLFPFSPAKEGPFSGRGWTLYSGRSIGAALGQGIIESKAGVRAAALSLAGAAAPPVSSVVSGMSVDYQRTDATPSAGDGQDRALTDADVDALAEALASLFEPMSKRAAGGVVVAGQDFNRTRGGKR